MQTTFLSGGQSIRVDVFAPDRATGPTAAVLILHGAGGNAGPWFERVVRSLTGRRADSGLAVYAVHYFDRTHTSRAELAMLSDGVHVPAWLSTVRDAVLWLGAQPGIDATRIALLGVSLGAFLGLALPTLPDAPPIRAIVDVSGGLVPPYADSATRSFPPTLIIHGANDALVPADFARGLEAILTRLGVEHAMHVVEGEGHWFSPDAQTRLLRLVREFLLRQLGLPVGIAQTERVS